MKKPIRDKNLTDDWKAATAHSEDRMPTTFRFNLANFPHCTK